MSVRYFCVCNVKCVRRSWLSWIDVNCEVWSVDRRLSMYKLLRKIVVNRVELITRSLLYQSDHIQRNT
jgi:hypothetical protein